MSWPRLIIYITCLLCAGAITPSSFGQNSVGDSVELSKAGKKAKADELYFDALKAKFHEDDKLSISLFEQFIALKPDVSAGYYELSKLYYGERKTDKSEEYLKKALALYPDNKWYKEEQASLLADRGNYDEAAAIVVELAKAHPQERNYPLVAAEYFEKAKKYEDALVWIDKALLANGNDEEILMHKVQVYLSLNNVEKAADVIRKLITNDPKNGKYYKWLGDLYDNKKMPAKATEVYDQAQKIIPGDATLQFGLAEHYLNMGDTAAYISTIKKVIVNKEIDPEFQIDMLSKYMQILPNDSVAVAQGLPILKQLIAQHPNNPEMLLRYGEFLENSNQHDSAMVAFKKSVELRPGSFEAWERLLRSYTDKKDADSLVKYSSKAMRLFPNLAMVSFYNSIGHMNKKEYPAAINAIKRAIDMQPETPESNRQVLADMYSLLGDIYHTNKQDDLSDKAFDKALQLDPGNASVLNNYSYYLSERGVKLDEAEKMSQKSLDIRPGEATFLDTYGWIQYKKGNYLKAKDFVERAINMSGAKADATLYDHLGNICYQLNEKAKAVEYWKKAKEKGADDPLIDKKISEGKLYE